MMNPFRIKGYAGAEFFCDRHEETKKLISFLVNGNNVVLSSPRRIGKTDLISHVFAQPEIAEHYTTIQFDIYATQTYSEFVSCFGRAIVNALRPRGKAVVDKFINVLHSLRSEITFDINGLPVWSVGIGKTPNPDLTLEEIFDYLEHADRPCIVAIDEFQQITKYGDEAWKVEATLRTFIQHCHNASFIYAGSQRHLMAEIFGSYARPFYASSTMMSLPLLDKEVYAGFCCDLFAKYERKLEPGVAEEVYERMEGVTAYMHRVMNQLFSMTAPHTICSFPKIDQAIDILLDSASESYTTLLYQMTEKQRDMLMAIAYEGKAQGISSGSFVRKHHLHSASSALSAAKTLLDKDMISRDRDVYYLSDKFFEFWLKRQL